MLMTPRLPFPLMTPQLLKVNKDLDDVQKWLKSNKLTLNVKKTKYMIIGSHYRLRHLNGDLNVTVNSQQLTRVTNYRYLGIEVDEALGWQSHVDTICKKVSAGIGALKRIRSLVPRQTLLKMYDALVAPYFDYCSEVWGCMGKGLCDRLQRLQNRAGRIITFSDYNTRSADILQDLGWDTLEQRRSKQLAISGLHSYNVPGASNNVFVPRPRTEAAKRAFSFRGAVMWNGLGNVLKREINLNSFNSVFLLNQGLP